MNRYLPILLLPLLGACGTAGGDLALGMLPGQYGEVATALRNKAMNKAVDAADFAIDTRCVMTAADRQTMYDMLVEQRRTKGKVIPTSLDCDGDGEPDLEIK